MTLTVFLCLLCSLVQLSRSTEWHDQAKEHSDTAVLASHDPLPLNIFDIRDGWGHWNDADVQTPSKPNQNTGCAAVTSIVTVPGAGATVTATVTAAERTVTITESGPKTGTVQEPGQKTVTVSEAAQKTVTVSEPGQKTVTVSQPGQNINTTIIFLSTTTVAATTVTTIVKETSFATTISVPAPGEKASTTITTTSYTTLDATKITIIQTPGTPGFPVSVCPPTSTPQLDKYQKQTYQDICVGVYRSTTPWWATLLLVMLFLFGSLILAALALLMFAKKPWMGGGWFFASTAGGGMCGACGQSCAGSSSSGVCGACGQSCAGACARLEKRSSSKDLGEAETCQNDASGTCVWCGHSKFSCGGPILPILRVCGQSVDIDRSGQQSDGRRGVDTEYEGEHVVLREGRQSSETRQSHEIRRLYNTEERNQTEQSLGHEQASRNEEWTVTGTYVHGDGQERATTTGWTSGHEHMRLDETERTVDTQPENVEDIHWNKYTSSSGEELEDKQTHDYDLMRNAGMAAASSSQACERGLTYSVEQGSEDSEDQTTRRRTFESVRTYDSDQDFGGGLTSFFAAQTLKSRSTYDSEDSSDMAGRMNVSRRVRELAQRHDTASMRDSVQMLEKKHIVTGRQKNLPRTTSSLSKTSSYSDTFSPPRHTYKPSDRYHEYGASISSGRSSDRSRTRQSTQPSEFEMSTSSSPKYSSYSDLSSPYRAGRQDRESMGSFTSEYDSDRSKVLRNIRSVGTEAKLFTSRTGYRTEESDSNKTVNDPSQYTTREGKAGSVSLGDPFTERSVNRKASNQTFVPEYASLSQAQQVHDGSDSPSHGDVVSQNAQTLSKELNVIPTSHIVTSYNDDTTHQQGPAGEYAAEARLAYGDSHHMSGHRTTSGNIINEGLGSVAGSASQTSTLTRHINVNMNGSDSNGNFCQTAAASMTETAGHHTMTHSHSAQLDSSNEVNQITFTSKPDLAPAASSTDSYSNQVHVSADRSSPASTFTLTSASEESGRQIEQQHAATYSNTKIGADTDASASVEAEAREITLASTLKPFSTQLAKTSASYSDYDEDDLEFFASHSATTAVASKPVQVSHNIHTIKHGNNNTYMSTNLVKPFSTTLTKISESHSSSNDNDEHTLFSITHNPSDSLSSKILTTSPLSKMIISTSTSTSKPTANNGTFITSATGNQHSSHITTTQVKSIPEVVTNRHASVTVTDLGSFPLE